MAGPLYYLTLEEMADLLRVSRWVIRGMVRRGEIPFIKVGKQIRLHIDVLKMFEGNAAEEDAATKALYADRLAKMHRKLPYAHRRPDGTICDQTRGPDDAAD